MSASSTSPSPKAPPNLLTDPIGRVMLRTTIPMMFGIITMLLFNVVDTYFVGQLGTEALAAVSFTFPVTFTVVSLSIGIGIGTSAVVAKLQGEGKSEELKVVLTDAIFLAVILVICLSIIGYLTIAPLFRLLGAEEALLPYIHEYMEVWYFGALFVVIPMTINSGLRALGNTTIPSWVMAMAGVFNGIFDPLLIFGIGPFPELGVRGAAIASVIAWGAASVIVLVSPMVREKLISWHKPKWEHMKQSWRQVLTIALPAAASNMMTPVSAALVTAMIAELGTEAVAAFGVGSRMESISMIVILALSMTLPPFISQNLGAGNYERMRKSITMALTFSLFWQLLIYCILYISAPLIAESFSDNQLVIDHVVTLLRVVPLVYGCIGIVILVNSSLNALHKPIHATVLSVLRLFVFYIPFCYVGIELNGFIGLCWGMVLAYLIMSVVSVFWIRQFAGQSLPKVPVSA